MSYFLISPYLFYPNTRGGWHECAYMEENTEMRIQPP